MVPSELGIDAIIKTLMDHYEPRRIFIAEGYNFIKRLQGPIESIAKFAAGLKSLTATFKFRGNN